MPDETSQERAARLKRQAREAKRPPKKTKPDPDPERTRILATICDDCGHPYSNCCCG